MQVRDLVALVSYYTGTVDRPQALYQSLIDRLYRKTGHCSQSSPLAIAAEEATDVNRRQLIRLESTLVSQVTYAQALCCRFFCAG